MKKKTYSLCLFLMLILLLMSGSAEAGWVKSNDGSYTFYQNGKKLKSTWIAEKKVGFVTKKGTVYCYKKSGALYKGFLTTSTARYYMNSKGKLLKSTWITVKGKKYYATKTGALYRNTIVKIGSYIYSFSKNGSRNTGLVTRNGQTYYFNTKNGRRMIGLIKINGSYYYFDRSNAAMITNQSKVINGATYLFGADGKGTLQASANEKETPSAKVEATYYTDPKVSDETLLAAIIYCEAGNQPYYGQVAVGIVITNRLRDTRFPSKLKEVIYEYQQFSPTADGALNNVLLHQEKITSSAKSAAAEVLSKYKSNLYTISMEGKTVDLKDYIFFMTNAAYERNNMASAYIQIKDHRFMKEWKRKTSS